MPFTQTGANASATFNKDYYDIQGNYIVFNDQFKNLNALAEATGASWSAHRGCLEGTRVEIQEEIMDWINNPALARILCLRAVAGAGKTALATEIAKRCAKLGILVSSFFFRHDSEELSTPDKLFTTFARHISTFNSTVAEHICHTIESDRSILCSSYTTQLEELVVKPFHLLPGSNPRVFIIDALDECRDGEKLRELLKALRTLAPKLPQSFRIIVTTRPTPLIVKSLNLQTHIATKPLDLLSEANITDITTYIRTMLAELAAEHELDLDEWARDESLIRDFSESAEGSFIWASTAIGYLRKAWKPKEDLQELLARQGGSHGLERAEKKLYQLYSLALMQLNWGDQYFLAAFRTVMGMVVVAKEPLSISALTSLNPALPSLEYKRVLGELQAVLHYSENKPIRLLHKSFYAFITTCAPNEPYYILVPLHEEYMARFCLHFLVQELCRPIDGVGYLQDDEDEGEDEDESESESDRDDDDDDDDEEGAGNEDGGDDDDDDSKDPEDSDEDGKADGDCANDGGEASDNNSDDSDENDDQNDDKNGVPRLLDGSISEELWYCCQFWMRHCLSLPIPLTASDRDALQKMIDDYLVIWVEISASKGTFHGLEKSFLNWLELFWPDAREHVYSPPHLRALKLLRMKLSYSKRRSEAVLASESIVERFMQLQMASPDPDAFNADIAEALNTLSHCQSNMGLRKEALETTQHAVELYTSLAALNPTTFNADLANSINHLAIHQSDMGLRKEALETIQLAVKIRKQLAASNPKSFNSDLAESLNNLSNRQSNMGLRKEALETIEQAVEILTDLATSNPAGFNADLATSLNNFSNCQSDMGLRKEALETIQRAVEIRTQLAALNPTAFNEDLAMSLSNLSNCQSKMGLSKEALATIQQAVELYTSLAATHPSVFNSDLASSLNNFSNRQSDMGLCNEALETAHQVVELYTSLAALNPTAFNEDLAMSLSNMSIDQYKIGCPKAALETIQQAVEIRTQLAASIPAAFDADLAHSLKSLSQYQSKMGQREEALDTIQQVVAIYTSLAASNPTAFNADLASSLNDFSNRQSDIGLHKEALEATQQAVELYTSLATLNPTVFNGDLAKSLNNLSIDQYNMGLPKEALETVQQAVEIRTRLAASNPAAFKADLAHSLKSLSQYQSEMGLREEALETLRQVVEIYTSLAALNHTAFDSHLAESLIKFFNRQSDAGLQKEAFETIQWAVEIRTQLAAKDPALGEDLAKSLHLLSKFLSDMGGLDEAQEVKARALALGYVPLFDCDSCDQRIGGVRHQCNDCSDSFDLCDTCWTSGKAKSHISGHSFKFIHPLPSSPSGLEANLISPEMPTKQQQAGTCPVQRHTEGHTAQERAAASKSWWGWIPEIMG